MDASSSSTTKSEHAMTARMQTMRSAVHDQAAAAVEGSDLAEERGLPLRRRACCWLVRLPPTRISVR
jgi:hypothetical protein